MQRSWTIRALVGALAVCASAGAWAQQVTLRGVNAFQEGTAFAKPFEDFIEKVNADGKGVIQIQYIGGPKAMPPFEVGNAVKTGVVDIANVTSAFYTNLMPEAEALKLATQPIQQQRKNGAWEYLNKLHNEKMNAWYLARTGDGVPFHLYVNKPLDKADLKGLTIRVTPIYRAFFAALGANLVQTAPGEVYTALERGVVDGYGWPIQGIFDLGWQEKTKYRVDPGFYQVDVNILVNLDRWKKLTDAQRDVLTKAAQWVEERNALNAGINAAERKRQAQAGIQTITLQGAELDKWNSTAQEAGWAYVKEIAPQRADELRKLLAP
ncbi:MAG: TRAP transporter substrate-binding protein DctP [Burkholderiaceae bacterium]|nr:TRAP transporter substrate-binding protein DctP [Burkholderiaceae bacterium]